MTDIIPTGTLTQPLAPADTNVAKEGGAAGAAFGDLIKLTGQAVADTQTKLNETMATTATALAETLVDVVAVQERIYDDQGNVTAGASYTMKLPLVTFIDPVVYEWDRVRLQGYFYANEFASETDTSSSSFAFSASGRANPLFGVGRSTLSYVSSNGTVTVSDDVSYGSVRMNALLTPRRDTGIPKPTQVIQGPSIFIIAGEIQDELEDTPQARTMSLMIEYRRPDGTAIPGKALSIETDGVTWSFDGESVTDEDGRVRIVLRRVFLDEKADRTPKDFIVTARIGILQNNTTITF